MASNAGPVRAKPKNTIMAAATVSGSGRPRARTVSPTAEMAAKEPNSTSTRPGDRRVIVSTRPPPTKAPATRASVAGSSTSDRWKAVRPYVSARKKPRKAVKITTAPCIHRSAMNNRRTVRTAHTVRHDSPNDSGSSSRRALSSSTPSSLRSM